MEIKKRIGINRVGAKIEKMQLCGTVKRETRTSVRLDGLATSGVDR